MDEFLQILVDTQSHSDLTVLICPMRNISGDVRFCAGTGYFLFYNPKKSTMACSSSQWQLTLRNRINIDCVQTSTSLCLVSVITSWFKITFEGDHHPEKATTDILERMSYTVRQSQETLQVACILKCRKQVCLAVPLMRMCGVQWSSESAVSRKSRCVKYLISPGPR